KIKKELSPDKIIFEAPQKNQQIFFIKEFGSNVNLGNVAYQDVIALETLRLGLRGDTFFNFFPEEFEEYRPK
ncbi:MAG TPA: phosphosulfolactate synthase, partial [Bacteroidales bacterium]|nr:phosphosulfolactate synthase [Bacteroidales bacterium]